MRKYLAELIGTFALVFGGCGAIIVDSTEFAGLGNIAYQLYLV